jgi:hypothetical protein
MAGAVEKQKAMVALFTGPSNQEHDKTRNDYVGKRGGSARRTPAT